MTTGSLRVGSLFSGAGGLDLAVEQVFGATTVWHCESDPAAARVLAHRWPKTPNLGDITTVDWAQAEPVDVLCGGFPCQDVSAAGKHAGLASHTRSGLWTYFADAIDQLQPGLVVIENVKGLLHAKAHRAVEPDDAAVGDRAGRPVLRAIGAVLGDLSDLGYDAQWATVPAASVGAPHLRQRVFIVATDATSRRRPQGQPLSAWQQRGSDAGPGGDSVISRLNPLLPTPEAKNSHASQDFARATRPGSGGDDLVTAIVKLTLDLDLQPASSPWGKYEPAIARWETLTRPAPAPTEPNAKGNPRLSAAFSEWMMGWPAGWVTAVPGISRNDALRIIGNGVVPQQASAALGQLLAVACAA